MCVTIHYRRAAMNVEKMKQVKGIAKSEAPHDETIDLVGILTGGHRRPRGCQTDEWPDDVRPKETDNTKSTEP